MKIYDTFSKRQHRARGGFPDVYVYDHLPNELRVQIVHIINDAVGKDRQYGAKDVADLYRQLRDILVREYGVFNLGSADRPRSELINFFLETDDVERALDVVELVFRAIHGPVTSPDYRLRVRPEIDSDSAINELNARFKEHGVGYEFIGEIVRVDSQFLHAEAVRPALALLAGKLYPGANEEFLAAHEHYRHKRYEEAIVEALKALESTLKAILDKRKWAYSQSDTAKKLLEIVFANELIPSYLQSEFTGLRSTLESGVPTVRNKEAGHGQGVVLRDVPEHLTAYILHLTASSILYLARSEQALP